MQDLETIIAKAVAEVLQTLAVEPEAAVEPTVCGQPTKAGTPCKAKTPCRWHGEAEAPKAKAAPKTTDAKAVTLRKATRRDFIAAVKAQQGVDLAGTTTKELARLVVAGEIEEPEGFVVGEGYRKVVSG